MLLRTVVLAAAFVLSAPAHAQSKKDLVQRVLQLQQPGIEAAAKQLAEQPANGLLQRAGLAIQAGVPADKREALAKDIQSDAKKYADDATAILRKRAVELAPTSVGPLLEERFSEEELRQLVAILESPIYRKYQSLGGEMQKALAEKLVADTRSTIEPKIRALEQQIAQRLNAVQKSGAASAPAPAASKK